MKHKVVHSCSVFNCQSNSWGKRNRGRAYGCHLRMRVPCHAIHVTDMSYDILIIYISSYLFTESCKRWIIFAGMPRHCVVPDVLFWFCWTQLQKANNFTMSKCLHVRWYTTCITKLPQNGEHKKLHSLFSVLLSSSKAPSKTEKYLLLH